MEPNIRAPVATVERRLLLLAVPGGDVTDFVAEYAGKLRLIIKVGHDAPREIHVSIRSGEGVDDRRIDNGKAVVVAGPVGYGLLICWPFYQ